MDQTDIIAAPRRSAPSHGAAATTRTSDGGNATETRLFSATTGSGRKETAWYSTPSLTAA
jgi:hypothetical protein